MHDLKGKIDEMAAEFEKIKDSVDMDELKNELNKLQGEASQPDFWDDQEKARETMQKIGDIQKEIEAVEGLNKKISDLVELSDLSGLTTELKNEADAVQKKLDKLMLATYLSGRFDKKYAIVSIHAGQGGTEAMDWTSMLLRMYLRYCEKMQWPVEILDETAGEEAGIKSVTFRVAGKYAYGYLKHESGTHRLVRQSPFNADNLRQTSFALVEVLPEFEDIDVPEVKISDDELEWQFYRAGGHGGQNVNKVSTAVRLTHTPSGIVVTSSVERYQEKNRQHALSLLRSKLWQKEMEKREKMESNIKGEYTPATWGTQIRSYVLHPYKMVKDLRTEAESPSPENVLDGDLDMFIEEELRQLG